ncbi:MAG: hypothetical protein H6510_03140 [Acidobacteria bacterium]|nr:hypothetical protein [Acidobacteriota bacterium]
MSKPRFIPRLAYGLLFLLFLIALIWGGDFYLTPYSLRPRHPDYRMLRPAGTWGLVYGVVGMALMLLLLLYSLRKRTRLFGRAFKLKTWLDVHIFFGVAGPLLILLHTSFKFNGIVALCFFAMMAVAISGVLGRYLYLQIPKNIQGREISLRELEADLQSSSEHLGLFLAPAPLEHLLQLLDSGQPPNGNWATLNWAIRSDWSLRSRSHRARQFLLQSGVAKDRITEILDQARERALLKRRVASLRVVHDLFHYWHVIHRPFAAVMYLIALVHIVIAALFAMSW